MAYRDQEKKKAFDRKYQRAYNQTQKGKFYQYRANAKRRGVEFNLSFEEFISFWQKPCFLCDHEIKTIGLDRLDNEKGYTVNNVIPCCHKCNRRKNSLGMEWYRRLFLAMRERGLLMMPPKSLLMEMEKDLKCLPWRNPDSPLVEQTRETKEVYP